MIERNVGLVIIRRSFKVGSPLCRTHGMATSKEYLGKTLLFGWWGLISFFYNFFAVGSDISAYFAFRRLSTPKPAPVLAGRPRSMADRRPS